MTKEQYKDSIDWEGNPVNREKYFNLSFSQRLVDFTPCDSKEVRVVHVRGSFLDVFDGNGIVQLFIDKELRKSIQRQENNNLNEGDVVRVSGVATESKQSNKIIAVHTMDIVARTELSPHLNPERSEIAPYVIAIINTANRLHLIESQSTVKLMENILDANGFVRVITSPFETADTGLKSKAINLDKEELVLRRDFDIATRAFVPLTNKVYQLGPVFHNEGVSNKNRREFLFANIYGWGNMNDGQKLALKIVSEVVACQGKQVPDIRFVNYVDFAAIMDIGVPNDILESLKNGGDLSLEQRKILRQTYNEAKRKVADPILISGCPLWEAPFAKKDCKNPFLAEDFRLIWQGRTIFHGSQENNTANVQIERYKYLFGEDYRFHISPGEQTYLELLRYGFPNYWGFALSVDLLTQLSTDENDVRDLRPTIV